MRAEKTAERSRRDIMSDTTVAKVDSKHSPKGELGQKYLVSGTGKAELEIEGQKIILEPGDSWLVPKNSSHTYRILETFTAVEATSPPAEVHGRDAK